MVHPFRLLLPPFLLTLCALSFSCSGTMHPIDEAQPSDQGAHDAGPDGTFDGDANGTDVPTVNDAPLDRGSDSFSEGGEAYVDPGCPNPPEPVYDYACNPIEGTGCDELQGCYPFVQYPSEPCGAEVYGAMCIEAGFGEQGDSCHGPGSCASGFVCVVSGAGTQCVKVCSLTDPTSCPNGMICEALDVAGYGGCL